MADAGSLMVSHDRFVIEMGRHALVRYDGNAITGTSQQAQEFHSRYSVQAGRREFEDDVRPLIALRGNVDTRLRKLHAGEFDAAVLAAAGLQRLGLSEHIAACFAPDEMLPACGQGALAVQCRADDANTQQRLAKFADAATTVATAAERAFSLRLGGSCQTPLGGHARLLAATAAMPLAASPATGRMVTRSPMMAVSPITTPVP